MLKKHARALVFALAAVAGMPAAAQAAAHPYTIPGATRLVQFRYDPNTTYTVLARPLAITDIQFGPDETIKTLAIGDTIQWITAHSAHHIFIKPVRPGLFTSATVVTTKRVYQLTFRSSPLNGAWYQRVSWTYPGLTVQHFGVEKTGAAGTSPGASGTDSEPASESGSNAGATAAPPHGVHSVLDLGNASHLHFGYHVSGNDVPFKPTQVFDNGTFTYIAFRSDLQSLPALFVVTHDGKLELANYNVTGRYLVVQRTFHKAVLRLGSEQVTISKKANGDG